MLRDAGRGGQREEGGQRGVLRYRVEGVCWYLVEVVGGLVGEEGCEQQLGVLQDAGRGGQREEGGQRGVLRYRVEGVCWYLVQVVGGLVGEEGGE